MSFHTHIHMPEMSVLIAIKLTTGRSSICNLENVLVKGITAKRGNW